MTITAPNLNDLVDVNWAQQITDQCNALIQQFGPTGLVTVNPPSCAIYTTNAQSISNGVVNAITWNASVVNVRDSDINGSMLTPSGTTALTVRTGGLYLMITRAHFATGTAGARGCASSILTGGLGSYYLGNVLGTGDDSWAYYSGQQTATTDARVTSIGLFSLAAGTAMGASVIQNSGGALNMAQVEMQAIWLSF